MGTADGSVGATTKIVDHGPDAARWTMVILAEGFRTAELDQFRLAAESFVTKLFTTPPFDRMWCAINVYRVDVSSTDSGADEPATCGDGTTGTGTTARTYFDSSFCTANTGRLLWGNEGLALATAQAAVPEVDATVVIVNSTRYGGAGGSVAWFSRAAAADEIGVHELCHSAFRLADEYGDTIATWSGGEPPEPNVTTITARATTKWAARIAAATPLPTQDNTGCAAMTTAASPVPAGTVGLFAGGSRAFCGIYHAEHACRMQTLGKPFCAVCSDAIVARLRPHLPAFSGPVVGTQFHGTLAARETKRWFTYNWPACWHVLWTAVPTTPVTTAPSVRMRVRVERSSRERITYWLAITNDSDSSVEVDGRYEIVARA
jgi:IgA Peptidase M64